MRNYLFYLLLSVFPFQGFGQLLSEGFEGTTFPPAGWTTFVGTNGLGTGFNWTRATSSPYEGAGYAFVRYENVTGGIAEDWMVTPAIDLSDYENAELTFYTRQDFNPNWGGNYYVKVSTTSQTAPAGFADVASWTELTLNTTYNVYEQKNVDLSAYDGQIIYIAFVMTNDDGDSWYVDNVVVNADEVVVEPGCLDAPFGQWPSGAPYVPSCSGVTQSITANAWTGEYSLVQVTEGTEYTFSSSIATDYVTIGNSDGTTVLVSGLCPITWTADADQVIRFYLHLDEDCNSINSGLRARTVQCGEAPPSPANDDCANAIALSCGDSDSGSTAFANNSGGNAAADVFYTYTGSGSGGLITVSLCDSGFDTFVRVFSDCTLTEEIAFNDDSCGLQSEVQFDSDGTSTYVIMVEGFSSNVGNYTINISCEITEPEPGDGCFVTGQFAQWPSSTFVPSCSGTAQVIAFNCWAGEYSKVQVTAGTEYIFSSSVATDFITIADEDEDVTFATGIGSVTWTSPIDQVIRFYTHLNEDCELEELNRSRIVQCGDILPPPANDDCANAIALSCGDNVSGSTAFANNSGGNAAGDVFYTFTGTGAEEMITVSLCGSSYDTFIRIFSDCTLTNEIAFNDDSCGLQSEVSFVSDGISTYVIMVEGFSSNVGDYTINVSCEEITDYCEPVLNCTDGDLITNVTFAGIANNTDCSPGGYGDYTDQIATVEAESTNPISVTVGSGWINEAVSIWIDYNNNFIFEEDEFTFIGGGAGTAVTGEITIPADTPAGEYRMRVRVAAVIDDLATWNMACDEGQTFGETEDYTVKVGELGVSDLNSSEFSFYPNPVKDVLNITSKKQVENVAVFNLTGQQVMDKLYVSNGQVSVSSLTPGVYVFNVTLEGGQIETFKIIKK